MSGRMKYVPKIIIDEIEDLKTEHKIEQDSVAMFKMVEYTRVGREMERLMTFRLKHKPTKINRRRMF